MPIYRERAPIDTVYPVSPTGDVFSTVPPPLSSDLQSLLNQIGKQDLGPQG
jgi:hypothetical protein